MTAFGAPLAVRAACAEHAAGAGTATALAALELGATAAQTHPTLAVPAPTGGSAPVLYAPSALDAGDERIAMLLQRLLAGMPAAADAEAAYLLLPDAPAAPGQAGEAEALAGQVAAALGIPCQAVTDGAGLPELPAPEASAPAGRSSGPFWLIGADSLVGLDALLALDEARGLRRSGGDGLLAGEAAAAVLLAPDATRAAEVRIEGWSGQVQQRGGDAPALADVLGGALAMAGRAPIAVDRILLQAPTDAAAAVEWAEAAARLWPTRLRAEERHAIELGLMPVPKDAALEPPCLPLTPVLGHVGAAWLPLAVGIARQLREAQARWAAWDAGQADGVVLLVRQDQADGHEAVVLGFS